MQFSREAWPSRNQDGADVWSACHAVVQHNAPDGSVSVVEVHTDITARKALENELKLTSFSMDQIEDAVYRILPDARIVRVNGAACRMLGYTREELAALREEVHDLRRHVTVLIEDVRDDIRLLAEHIADRR